MMLGKLIGWAISTQVASVRNPASTIGARVNATSRRLRSAQTRRAQITISEVRPAWMKAQLMVRPAAWIEIGAPLASGAASTTTLENLSRVLLSFESPAGEASLRARPSRVPPAPRGGGGRGGESAGWAWRRAAVLVQHALGGRRERRFGARAGLRRPVRQ